MKIMRDFEEYRGFNIHPDRIYGWSLIGPSGSWCCSKTTKEGIKKVVDSILEDN